MGQMSNSQRGIDEVMEAEITVADYHRLPRLRAESQSIKLRLLGLINKLDECLTDKPLDKDILLNKYY